MRTSLSSSPFAAELLAGRPQTGIGLGHGFVMFRDRVLAITPPGAPRMPNGIECELVVARGEPVSVGDGELRTTTASMSAGPLWDPRPHPRVAVTLRPQPQLRPEELAGRGPGLTPLGDDVLIGYLAASTLAIGGGWVRPMADRAGTRTTSLSRTLLHLAARGWLPEPAHSLLVDGDPEPLLQFGATSGTGILFGLALGGARVEMRRAPRLASKVEHGPLELSESLRPDDGNGWHWSGEYVIARMS